MKKVLAGMQEAMGPLPGRAGLPPLDVRIMDTSNELGVTRCKLTFLSERDDRVPAYLLYPPGIGPGCEWGGAHPARQAGGTPAPRAPAMLALHWTSPRGKDEPVGLGVEDMPYGLELARHGYVVLAPDYPSYGEYPYDFNADAYVSGSMKGIFNHMRCVDVLASLDEVDPSRIGAIGHSLGGHNSIFLAAFDERIKVIVTSCGWTPFNDYYGGDLTGWTPERYMPRIRDVYHMDPGQVPFDFYELIASLAPRAFFSHSPVDDDNFSAEAVRKAMAFAGQVYASLGASNQLSVCYPVCGHNFPREIREEAYAFIDQALKR